MKEAIRSFRPSFGLVPNLTYTKADIGRHAVADTGNIVGHVR
jgi:hypothetical protein